MDEPIIYSLLEWDANMKLNLTNAPVELVFPAIPAQHEVNESVVPRCQGRSGQLKEIDFLPFSFVRFPTLCSSRT